MEKLGFLEEKNGYLWESMVSYGKAWFPMEKHSFPVFHGESMVSHWESMDSYGKVWFPMVPYAKRLQNL